MRKARGSFQGTRHDNRQRVLDSFREKLLLWKLEGKWDVWLERIKDNWKMNARRKLFQLVGSRVARPDLLGNYAQHVVRRELRAHALHKSAPLLPGHQIAKLIACVHQDRVPALLDELARVVLVQGARFRRPVVGFEHERVAFSPHVQGIQRPLRLGLHALASSCDVNELDMALAQKVQKAKHLLGDTTVLVDIGLDALTLGIVQHRLVEVKHGGPLWLERRVHRDVRRRSAPARLGRNVLFHPLDDACLELRERLGQRLAGNGSQRALDLNSWRARSILGRHAARVSVESNLWASRTRSVSARRGMLALRTLASSGSPAVDADECLFGVASTSVSGRAR